MSNDGGTMAKVEEFIVDTLAALEYNGVKVFKTADHWDGQIGQEDSGKESFERYTPFAFVKGFHNDPDFEGDRDLKQSFRFAVCVGQSAKTSKLSRIGDDKNLGVSMLHDLVIDAINGKHPGSGIQTECLFFDGASEVVDGKNKYAEELQFKADYIKE
jgi:hypothetical protein